jgi:hypothetical protein
MEAIPCGIDVKSYTLSGKRMENPGETFSILMQQE